MILPSPAGGIQGARQCHSPPFNHPTTHLNRLWTLLPTVKINRDNIISHAEAHHDDSLLRASHHLNDSPPTTDETTDSSPADRPGDTAMSLALDFLRLTSYSSAVTGNFEKVQAGNSPREAARIPQLLAYQCNETNSLQ
jgi:hypothetical protein